jgi:D-amino-acid oxidase
VSRRIAVVGQGVIGLTSASRLLDEGYSVEIFSREPLSATTSLTAGAYWWPHKTYPEHRVSQWAKETYDEYVRAKEIPETGVHFQRHFRFCVDPDDSAYVRHLVESWEEIDGSDYGVDCVEAFLLTLPVIDVPTFMGYLEASVERRGARFWLRELQSPAELFPDFDLVVNCSGVWAYHFVGDREVFPIRGQVVRVSLPEGLADSTRLYRRGDELTLVLPRRHDVVLGGTSQKGNWDRSPQPEETEAIVKRCAELVPEIADSEVLGVFVGLRPGRAEVRLELELATAGQPVVHNYGHGGGGYTVAWGCANEVARRVVEYFSAAESPSMSNLG